MVGRWLTALAVGLLSFLGTPALGEDESSCPSGTALSFICGLSGAPEDLAPVPRSKWIIASGYVRQGDAPGGLNLINARTHAVRRVALAQARPRAPFVDCDGPPDSARFSAHGLNLGRAGRSRMYLYVVGHRAREAIEVFDVSNGDDAPRLTWIGCIRAPEGAYFNSVVQLPDGALVATDFLHGSATLRDIAEGRITGAVYQWRPGGRFEKLSGTDLPGPNGVEATADGRWLFVAVGGRRSVLRYDLNRLDRPAEEVNPGLRTDNLRWASDGRLLMAGPDLAGCRPSDLGCFGHLVVSALDTRTLQVTRILTLDPEPSFSLVSSAILVGDNIWLGSPNGNRAAYVRAPWPLSAADRRNVR
ncbi:MAG: hypothetical protein JWM33_1446 [Caulobacteraceae bacterium]|nr:hypothetical protein [Caulobacteraceae bacterium]